MSLYQKKIEDKNVKENLQNTFGNLEEKNQTYNWTKWQKISRA